jgi:ribosomal protein L7Ae-like RNA K-turn-binding protein
MNKLLNSFGLALRAGALISGENVVLDAITSRKAKLVLTANDISDGSFKKFNDKCNSNDIELVKLEFDRYQIGAALGKEFRVCIAVTDKNFVSMIKKKM